MFKQSFDEQLQQGVRTAGLKQQYGEMAERQHAQLGLEEQRAQIRAHNAQAAYAEARPDLEARKTAETAARREQNAVLANLRLLKGQKLDPANARHAALLQRAANAGIEVDPESWNESVDAGREVYFDVVDPANPTTKQRVVLTKGTGQAAPVTVNGQAATTGYVQPVHPDTGMTSAQEHTDADRDASRTETARHNRATETQAQANAAQRGQPSAVNTNSRLAQGAALVTKIEEEKAKAASPPLYTKDKDGKDVPTTPEWRTSYSARHKSAALRYRDQLQTGFGDLFEAGQDAEGWPYGKPKVQPATGARGAAPVQSRGRLKEANVPAAIKSLIEQKIVKDEAEARRYISEHYEVIK
ncbi:MAG TPA: hypothetical protein VF546_23335 [Pyrinomonadaceae bacterium]